MLFGKPGRTISSAAGVKAKEPCIEIGLPLPSPACGYGGGEGIAVRMMGNVVHHLLGCGAELAKIFAARYRRDIG
jgi:hypothetical protein